MILLSAHELRKYYGPEPVLDGVTFDVRPGERVGLVGPNGTGKTTLLKILARQLDADSGKVDLHSSARLGYLEQHPEFAPGRTVWDEAKSGLAELLQLSTEAERLAAALATCSEAERAKLGARYDYVQYQLTHHNAYNVEHRIERVLLG